MLKSRTLTERPADILNYEIDLGHPLAPSEGFFVFENGRVYNLIDDDQRSISVGAGVSFGSDNNGEYAYFNNASTASIYQIADAGLGLDEVTVVAQQSFLSVADHAVFTLASSGTDQDLLIWADSNAGGLRLGAYAGAATYSANSSIPADGTPVIVGVTADNATDTGVLYLSGENVGSGGIGTVDFGGVGRVYLGNNKLGTKPAHGNLHFLYLDKSIRTDSEVAELSENPWQLLQPKRRFFVVPASGPAPTFNPAWAANNCKLIGGM